jgi:3-dehydroquinate synthase
MKNPYFHNYINSLNEKYFLDYVQLYFALPIDDLNKINGYNLFDLMTWLKTTRQQLLTVVNKMDPSGIIIDVDTLKTLNEREFSAGMAEVIKYGLLGNVDFLLELEKNVDAIMNRDKNLIINAVSRSCEDKANIVAEDEFEHGKRSLLNFGHTFGHGIENILGYGTYLHGEAISIGMYMAAKLSELEGNLSVDDVERVKNILTKAKLPCNIEGEVSSENLIKAMSIDKKAIDGNIRLVLLKYLGDSYLSDSYSQENFQQVISNFCQ